MKHKLFIIVVILMFTSVFVEANLRAPFILKYSSGGALKPVPGLTVLHEKLKFDIKGYAAVNIQDVLKKKYICLVSAIYTVQCDTPASASFEFISPSDESIAIKVNGITAESRPETIVKDKDTGTWSRNIKTSYCIRFKGELKQDINVIEVTYIQPMSITETSYGYFRESRYLTYAGYEFWPIKEWKLHENFKADIEILVPYSWGITDTVFGQDIKVELKGYTKDMKTVTETVNGTYSHEKDILQKNCSLSGTIPDMLYIYISEK